MLTGKLAIFVWVAFVCLSTFMVEALKDAE